MLSVGDDAAILPSSKTPTVIGTDTLIDGVHFQKDFPPQNVASRALRVNISDFAAMGVKPTAMTMALSLPSVILNGWRNFRSHSHSSVSFMVLPWSVAIRHEVHVLACH